MTPMRIAVAALLLCVLAQVVCFATCDPACPEGCDNNCGINGCGRSSLPYRTKQCCCTTPQLNCCQHTCRYYRCTGSGNCPNLQESCWSQGTWVESYPYGCDGQTGGCPELA